MADRRIFFHPVLGENNVSRETSMISAAVRIRLDFLELEIYFDCDVFFSIEFILQMSEDFFPPLLAKKIIYKIKKVQLLN